MPRNAAIRFAKCYLPESTVKSVRSLLQKKKPGSTGNTLKDKLLLDSPERLVVNTGSAVFP